MLSLSMHFPKCQKHDVRRSVTHRRTPPPKTPDQPPKCSSLIMQASMRNLGGFPHGNCVILTLDRYGKCAISYKVLEYLI